MEAKEKAKVKEEEEEEVGQEVLVQVLVQVLGLQPDSLDGNRMIEIDKKRKADERESIPGNQRGTFMSKNAIISN